MQGGGGGTVNKASIWMVSCSLVNGVLATWLPLSYLSHMASHSLSISHTPLVGHDCITLTRTAAGLSFIHVSFSGIIWGALYKTVIIPEIC